MWGNVVNSIECTVTEQLPMPYLDGWRLGALSQRLRDEVGRVVHIVGLQQVADDLGATYGYLSNVLSGRDRHYWRADWLLYLLAKDPTTGLLEVLAEAGHCVVTRKRELTPAERLERMEDALTALGPELAAEVRRRAGL